MFIKRFLSCLAIIGFVALVVLRFPPFYFALICVALIALGLKEFFHFAEKKDIFIHKISAMIFGLLIPFEGFFQADSSGILGSLFIVILTCWLFMIQFTRRYATGSIASCAATLFGIIYISYFFSFLIKLRLLSDGAMLVAYLLLVVKSGDIGAYIFGSTLGRHKLIPRISPNKSVEGAIGGILVSVTSAVILRNIIAINLNESLLLGVVLGALALVGDLAESILKRDSKLKDSDVIFPGLGGSLDIIDSLLFTTPVFYAWAILVR